MARKLATVTTDAATQSVCLHPTFERDLMPPLRRLCSMPDPVRSLRELNRVVKPVGIVLLLDHGRIDKPMVGQVMDLLDPIISRSGDARVHRRVVELHMQWA